MSQTWVNAQARGVVRVGESVAAVAHRSVIGSMSGMDPSQAARYSTRLYTMGGQPVIIHTPSYMRPGR